VITYLPGNHAACDERWRYIRYRDGGEELYDRKVDPDEFHNLAGEARYASVKRELGRWMPKTSAPPQPERNQYDFDFRSYSWKRKDA
jgi:hypothetical protein